MHRFQFAFIAVVILSVLGACGGSPASPALADAGQDAVFDDRPPISLDVPPQPDAAVLDGGDLPDLPAPSDHPADAEPKDATDAAATPDVLSPADIVDAGDVARDAPAPCSDDRACVGSPTGAVCDTTSGRCVQCTPASDRCPRGQYCVAGMNVCAPGCADRSDCDGATPECNTATHTCVECLTGDCPGLGGAICIGNRCVGACMGPRACTSGQTCCMFACVDTQTSTENCGDCFRRCAPPNAVAACSAGVCGVARCVAPYGDCDGNAANGCEVNTANSVPHCGGCGMACASRPNTVTTCEMGACRYACASGFADCDGNTTNGCEVDVRTAVANCGMCGRVCAVANASPVCSAGRCAIETCGPLYGDCDGEPMNGCESNLYLVTSCGACGVTCPVPTGPHTVPSCIVSGSSASCGASCHYEWTDCDGNLANGCEAMGPCIVERELFYDGFEGGGSRWIMDPVWRVTNAGFFSPCAGTLEMFGERRVTDPCDVAGDVTLASPIDISRATALTLTHQSRSYVSGGVQLDVRASGDGGRTWSVVASQGTNTCGATTVDLGAFVGRSTLLLRFSYRGTRACDSGFWRLDEVRVRATVRNY